MALRGGHTGLCERPIAGSPFGYRSSSVSLRDVPLSDGR